MRWLYGYAHILIITGGVISQSHLFGPLPGYAVSLLGIGLLSIGIAVVHDFDLQVQLHRPIFVPLLVIWSVYLFHLFTDPTAAKLQRTPLFIVVSFLFVIVFPQFIPRRYYSWAVERVAIAAAIVAVPTIILGQYARVINVWYSNTVYTPIGSWTYHQPTSILSNPNTFAVLLLAGVFGALANYSREQTSTKVVTIFGLAFLIVLTGSRNGIVSLIAGGGAFLAALIAPATLLTYGVLAGCVGVIIVVFCAALVPIDPFASLPLSNRRLLWQAAAEAIEDAPIVGRGATDIHDVMNRYVSIVKAQDKGTHNSYIRMLISTGMIGGVSYIYLHARQIVDSLTAVPNREQLAIAGLFVALAVAEMFRGFALFGLSLDSTLIALSLGYSQTQQWDDLSG